MTQKTVKTGNNTRILLYKGESQYASMRFFVDSLRHGFRSLGVKTAILDFTNQVDGKFRHELFYKSRPTFTIGFNIWRSKLKDKEIYEELGIPHLAFFVDHPVHHFMDFNRRTEPSLIMGCIDRSHTAFLSSRFGKKETFFIGHGCGGRNQTIARDYSRRGIEILFPASLDPLSDLRPLPATIDPELRHQLKLLLDKYHSPASKAIDTILDETLRKTGETLSDTDYCQVARALDRQIRSMDRLRLLQEIKSLPVTALGEISPGRIGFSGRIDFRGSVAFPDLLRLLDDVKIIINRMPRFPDGTHERVLEGMAADCLVLTEESGYLKENFNSGEHLVFYDPDQQGNLKEKIEYYLNHEKEAAGIAKSGQARVLTGYTWKHRAQTILKMMERFL